ncbi:hypothetical protein ABIF38_000090 [Bradyrhizobium japonicum]|nr:hypothetical protein [Bradyrhizobium elkanii]UQD86033.1 transporter [Bradyrhizobium elkanii USDA 76]GLR98720.1 hypothetical protein GCM10007858_63630 [Bradyrhizobium liaoningense]MCP1737847.1 hypothetical protein [Bradyrhizobium elkanii]MCS3576007.1 hypothetical protein [Bradyrhizobium elkanii]
MYIPTGTLQGPAGLSNVGDPWWTFQPNLAFSYLKDGWNLTVNVFDERYRQVNELERPRG